MTKPELLAVMYSLETILELEGLDDSEKVKSIMKIVGKVIKEAEKS